MTVDNEGWRDASEITEDEDEEREYDIQSQLIEDASPQNIPEIEEEFIDEEVLYEFDSRWMNDFVGLTYLGYLEDTVEIPYHTFKIRTLKSGEKIKVTSIIQPLENSIGYARAYRAAVVAAGLVLVDGKPLLVGSKRVDEIQQKYQYVIDNWHDFVIDLLYEAINDLEGKVIQILKDIGVYKDTKQVAIVENAETAGEIEEE